MRISGKRISKKRISGTKKRLWPPKYYRGLTKKQAEERRREIQRFGAMDWKDPKAYVGFKTDKYARTKRKSTYTVQWNKLFPHAKTLKERSQVTGVPVRYLNQVRRKAFSAWRSGHRPGMTQQQWAYPRISSFLLCGKTHYTADAAIVRRAKKESAAARKWFKRCKSSKLTKI